MIVALFAYAYAIGERSSRGIERRCRRTSPFGSSAPTRSPITRRSPAFGSATKRRSPTSSAASSASAPRPAGQGASWRSTTKLAASASNHATEATSRSPARSSPRRRIDERADELYATPRRRAARRADYLRRTAGLASRGQGAARARASRARSRSRASAQKRLFSAAGAWSRTGAPSTRRTSIRGLPRPRVMRDGRRFGRPAEALQSPAKPAARSTPPTPTRRT